MMETQTCTQIKVKQFSLRGARISGLHTEIHEDKQWWYIAIDCVGRKIPIKILSQNQLRLKSIEKTIRSVLVAPYTLE